MKSARYGLEKPSPPDPSPNALGEEGGQSSKGAKFFMAAIWLAQ